jgi:hypothetical protein
MDVPDLAVLEQGGRNEQAAARAASRGSSSRIATSELRSWSW